MNRLNIGKGTIITYVVTLIVLTTVGWFAYVQASSFFGKVSDAWPEIEFAFHHKALVSKVAEKYASASAQAERDVFKDDTKPTAEQEALAELTRQLQQSK